MTKEKCKANLLQKSCRYENYGIFLYKVISILHKQKSKKGGKMKIREFDNIEKKKPFRILINQEFMKNAICSKKEIG